MLIPLCKDSFFLGGGGVFGKFGVAAEYISLLAEESHGRVGVVTSICSHC